MIVPPNWKAYFKRGKGTVEGLFTVQRSDGKDVKEKPVKAVQARSGAPSAPDSDWILQRSPIPRGDMFVRLTPNNKGKLPGVRGIGEFYPISSDGGDWTIWEDQIGNAPVPRGPNTRKRTEIGIHEENKIIGSAGCIVVVKRSDFLLVIDTFMKIRKEGFTHIPIMVL